MRVVVLGAGFGGLEVSTRLSEQLGDDADVVLTDRGDGFVFGFSKLDVMFGRTTPDAVRHPYKDILTPGVRFVQATVLGVRRAAGRLRRTRHRLVPRPAHPRARRHPQGRRPHRRHRDALRPVPRGARPPGAHRRGGVRDVRRRWIPVDPLTLETAFPDVYAVGDVTSVGTPKAGVFAEG